MSRPTVGKPSTEHRAVCLYSRRPDMVQCDQPATLHIFAVDARYGLVAMSTCARHACIARAAATFQAEHAHARFCGLPGTVWNPQLNACVIDDTGQGPAYALAGRKEGDQE